MTPSIETGGLKSANADIPSAMPVSVPPPSSTPASSPAPAFKLVKVRKPDGSIVTVKRKIAADEAPAAKTTTPPPKPTTGAFKIVTVRQPDGSLIKVRRAVKSEDEAPARTQNVTEEASSQDAAAKALAPAVETKTTTAARVPDSTAAQVRDPTDAAITQAKPAVTAPPVLDKEGPPTTHSAKPAQVDAHPSLQDALDEQTNFFRQRKRHAFKTRLLRGVAAVAGSAVPAIEIGDLMDGDELLSDSDWSVDEDNADDGPDGQDDHDEHDDQISNADNELHHGAQEHSQGTDDDEKTLEHNSDASGHVNIDAGAAIQGAGMAMAAAGSQPQPRQPLPATVAAGQPNPEKEKVTYKISAKELNQMEDKTAEKATRPLKKHWANVTFYIMASLSIILPLLFLLLGLFIILMKGKSTASSWGSMQDVIKVAISAWPIVFAAVTAQVFKAWATYKVERGIKLMELEQLVGSNSFGSAIKQPFLLRRLDMLTLLLLVVWCLSPLGSQALQRTYTIGPAIVNTTMPVLYLDMTVPNRFFSEVNLGMLMHAQTTNDVMQRMSNFYLTTFLPPAAWQYDLEDNYNHPKPIWLDSDKAITASATTSHYGVPLILSKSIFGVDTNAPTSAPGEGNLRWERTKFEMTSSYFDFQCGDWSVVNGSYFNSSAPGLPEFSVWAASLSKTAHYVFYSDDPATPGINRMRFGSLITNGSTAVIGGDAQITSGDESSHSLIDCSFTQKFVDFPVECYLDSSSVTGVADCTYETGTAEDGGWAIKETPPGNLKNTSGAHLDAGIGEYFAQNTAPFLSSSDVVTTPNEIYLGLYSKEETFDKHSFNLSALATPEEFSRRISYLFNTWTDLGNSVDYVTYHKQSDIQSGQEDQFFRVDASHIYTGGQVYFISIGWVAGYFICAGMLLVAGTVSVIVESMTVAPDVLGYVSTVARNSKYLQLPKTNSAMNGGERARVLGGTKVMMQDVKANADIGRIALGLKHEKAEPLRPGRLYR